MDIKLPKNQEQRLAASMRRFLQEELGEAAGDLKAALLLRFVLEEIAPAVYNQAVADARDYLQERVQDMENVLFAQEQGYWMKGGVPRRPSGKR